MHQVKDGDKWLLCTAYGPYTEVKEKITRNIKEFTSQGELVKELQQILKDKLKKKYCFVDKIPQGMCLPYDPRFRDITSPKQTSQPGAARPAVVTALELF